jgi:parvulin-like peptidyl-prolyl isomerase
MAFQTRDQFQDKASKKLDRVLNKKSKRKPLGEEAWMELTQRGATLAEQFEWLRLDKLKKERLNNG